MRRIIRAGTPPTIVRGSTSCVTTAPAATTAPSPMVTPCRIVAFDPIQTLRPTTIGGTTYECLYEDLTDIYTTDIPGEDVTIEEKLIDGVAEYYRTDGK